MTTTTSDGPAYMVRLDLAICSGVNGRASQDKRDGPPLTTATLPPTGMMQNGCPHASILGLTSMASDSLVRAECATFYESRIAHLLGIRCCTKHLGVTLKFLRVFLVCLKSILGLCWQKEHEQAARPNPCYLQSSSCSCNLDLLTTKDSLTQRSPEGQSRCRIVVGRL